MKRRFKPIEYSLIAIPFVGVAFITLSGVKWFHNNSNESNRRLCIRQLQHGIGMAFMQYIQDYDEILPLNRNLGIGKGGWRDEIAPYISRDMSITEVFQCPSSYSDSPQNSKQGSQTSYWFNSNLMGKEITSLSGPAVLLAGDGESEQSANYAVKSLPKTWVKDEKSPAYRHSGEANYLFLDGHVHPFKPEDISDSPNSNRTFFPRLEEKLEPTPQLESKTTSEPR